ncbi:hypothetical protein ISN45_Aa04g018290 [Arabidopsis thaliana x Arabidopsis arenosa]|uniref:Uncharacterized protein n=1 Tax=Arabidopsis thaliana x Arabidopsis arenosa TaxID=1240361 RepID=A0A8T2A8P5_9BRAS|nr:hypothetical protein ISN45_Aa04g018290 [Arabidopsis thaliana x Arabidopsis arenosa]
MSVMIESKRPPVYIDNQMSLDTFFLIRGGDPSVNLFVSFITTVKALRNNVPRTDRDDAESDRVCGSAKTPNPIVAASNVDANNEAVDEQEDVQDDKTDEDEEEEDTKDGDGYDDYQGDDGSMGGSTLDHTIDGSEGEFSRLLAECTYTRQRVPGGDNISHSGDRTPTVTPRRTCQHSLYQCTYTTECVQDTGCEGNTDTNINGIDEVTGDDVIDRGIGASSSGTLNDNRLVTVPGGDNISHLDDSTPTVTLTRTCRHGLYQCTYTIDCVQDTGCEGDFVTYTDTNYGKYGISGLFFSAAKDYRVRDFEKYFEQLRAKRPGCANYLEKIGFEHWTRAHCKGERYNIMSSNNSQAMNNVLTKAKAYLIVYMIEFIREVLMRWFAARRKKVARCKSLVTPEVDERFLQDLPASGKYAVKMSRPWSYQVTNKSGEHFHVVLDEFGKSQRDWAKRFKAQIERKIKSPIKLPLPMKSPIRSESKTTGT